MAYGATEPQAGSDLAAMTTKAVPVEENGAVVGYKISGQKQWISNGGVADLYTILALAAVLERCRLGRLTRQQHILFRLGELVAYVETAVTFSHRVINHPTQAIPLDAPTRQAMARIHARDAALKVATDGLR